MIYPILYSFKRCPYAMRARMALHLAEIKCEIREIRLSNKPEHMLEVSPKGTVPICISGIPDCAYEEVNASSTLCADFIGNSEFPKGAVS